MDSELELFDVVSLNCDLAQGRFRHGTEGTIVEVLERGVFLVEFDGDTELVLPAVKKEQFNLVWRKGLNAL